MAELESLAASPTAPMAYVTARAVAELTCGHVGSGDLDSARATLRRLEELAGRCYGGPEGRTLVARTAATVALASGDTAAAREHGAIIGDPFWRHATTARIALAEGDGGVALDALELALPRCARHELVLHLLRARAALDTDLADKHALAAVEVATANDLLQTVAAEGVEAAELVERCAWRAPDGWIDRLRRGAVTGGGTVRAPVGVGVETLTERERDVLRFLPSRLTLREIAQELYISTNTLKFHLKVIYRKLGVNSRHEAAAVARGLTTVRTR
jgi:LuxR family maltose regulon positive regulatory protein